VLAEHIDLDTVGTLQKLAYRFQGHINKVAQWLVRWPDVGRERHGFSWRRIKSCNLGVWRTDLELVNGFDGSFVGWGFEDADLVVRLFNAGVMRKDGSFATEVFHLWHHDAPRDAQASNQRLVRERAASKTIVATLGLNSLGEQASDGAPR
jgi:hypothetical protein